MTEQEIIDYLKNNKNEGRIISFMPEEVKRWCEEHIKELLVWQSHRWYKFDAVDICTDDAVTLPDDYKVEKESKGGWVEFEIDDDGDFCYTVESERGEYHKTFYPWYSWQKFLDESTEDGDKFTAFGGWQYPNSSYWSTYPQVKTGRGDNYSSYYCEKERGEDYPAYPAIPVKIRFWKEKLR